MSNDGDDTLCSPEFDSNSESRLTYWAPRPVTHGEEILQYCRENGIVINVMEDPALPNHLMLKGSPGKGQGVFAVEDIPEGSLILRENVLVTNKADFNDPLWTDDPHLKKSWNEYLGNHLKWRGNAIVRAYLSLQNVQRRRYGPLAGVFASNKIIIDLPVGNFFGVGIRSAKVNHSCVPNAQQVWENTREQDAEIMGDIALYAVKHIKAGEEITIQYSTVYSDVKIRQDYLKRTFGFTCSCHTCITKDPLHERLFEKMIDIVPRLYSIGFYIHEPWTAFRDAFDLIKWFSEMGINDIRLSLIWELCGYIAATHSDKARAFVFFTKASKSYRITQGKGSEMAMIDDGLANYPEQCPRFGWTTLGTSSLEDSDMLAKTDGTQDLDSLFMNGDYEGYMRLGRDDTLQETGTSGGNEPEEENDAQRDF